MIRALEPASAGLKPIALVTALFLERRQRGGNNDALAVPCVDIKRFAATA